MSDTQETYVVTFRPKRNNPRQASFVPGIIRLRKLLKIAGRLCGLEAVEVREVHDQADPQAPPREAA